MMATEYTVGRIFNQFSELILIVAYKQLNLSNDNYVKIVQLIFKIYTTYTSYVKCRLYF